MTRTLLFAPRGQFQQLTIQRPFSVTANLQDEFDLGVETCRRALVAPVMGQPRELAFFAERPSVKGTGG